MREITNEIFYIAFWLRSSVVSVLFSLISEIPLMWILILILFLQIGNWPLCLHMLDAHCVTGIALSPVDATFF
jgi:hypothetical protein